jgi:hypothetical protein
LILLFLFVLVTGFNYHDSGAEPDRICIEQLRIRAYFLASDYLGGRVMGSRGYRIAAEYAASQMSAAGLHHFPSARTDQKGFLHPVPLPDHESDAGDATGACCNVIGYIPGTDPRPGGEYIVVSAHLDHIPSRLLKNSCSGAFGLI